MLLLLFLIIGSLAFFIAIWLICWGIHVSSSIKYTYDWATYKDFLNVIDRENQKHALKKECRGYSSKRVCYDKPRKYTYSDAYAWDEYIRCSNDIVEINNKYMVFYPIDYLQYLQWLRSQTRSDKRVKGLWKDVNQWDY